MESVATKGTRAALLESYEQHYKTHPPTAFFKACAEAGFDKWLGHIVLMQAGVLRRSDRIRSNNIAARHGAMGEEKFKEFLPEAADANENWKFNNPGYDFCYKAITIDVKYAGVYKRESGRESYSIKMQGKGKRTADFFAVFLDHSPQKDLTDFSFLLVPALALEDYNENLHITKGNALYNAFQVDPKDVKKHFDMLLSMDGL